MQASHTNELIHETSPYLLQHAHNPVQWYPWGDKALTKSKEENKPILVSIGYSACHWCHVMERESFENEQVAAFMNEHFVNIKIDREERPDLDQVYMDAVQALTGSGGWPLNVFLTTEAKPFFGGTYYPPVKMYNRLSWIEVLQYIVHAWTQRKDEVEAQAEKLLSHIDTTGRFFNLENNDPAAAYFTVSQVQSIRKNLMKNADKNYGGFGLPPKFPQFHSMQFLLAAHYFSSDEESYMHACESLKAILRGGIYDQLAGGMARYSTDEKWLVPHFEKMLYDNALLVAVLSDAYQLSSDAVFADGIHKTLQFCMKELKHAEGGYYAALDADSEGEEGLFYTWHYDEVVDLLGKEAELFCKWFNIIQEGNWEGKNILHSTKSEDAFASENKLSVDALNKIIEAGVKQLLSVRNTRIRPGTDDKMLFGWNALQLTAFCKAAAALKNDVYRQEAIALHRFIKTVFIQEDGSAKHSYKNKQARHPAYLDDYAFYIQALLLLQEITGMDIYLQEAEKLTHYVIEHFTDEQTGFFFYTHQAQTDIIIRKTDIYDGATPSGNSIMASNLLYLGNISGRADWRNRGISMLKQMNEAVIRYPGSFGVWANLLQRICYGEAEIAITGKGSEQLSAQVMQLFIPNRVLQFSAVPKDYPLLQNKSFENQPLIYLCEHYSCQAPVDSVENLKNLLKK